MCAELYSAPTPIAAELIADSPKDREEIQPEENAALDRICADEYKAPLDIVSELIAPDDKVLTVRAHVTLDISS